MSDYDDGRYSRGYGGGDWNDYMRGRNDAARWNETTKGSEGPPSGGWGGSTAPGGGVGTGGGTGVGGGGGAGLIFIVLFVVIVALAVPAAILAALATPILVFLGRRRRERWDYGELYVAVAKACFVLVALNAALFYLLAQDPQLFGGNDFGLDMALAANALFRMTFATDLAPPLTQLAASRGFSLASALSSFAMLELVPFLAMAWTLHRSVDPGFRAPISYVQAVIAAAMALASGLILWGASLALLYRLGTPMPISLPSAMIYAGLIAGGTALGGGLIFSIAGAVLRQGEFRELANPAMLGLFVWGMVTALLFYFFRGADDFIFSLLYPSQSPDRIAALDGLPFYVALQLPGLFFASRALDGADAWRRPVPLAIATLALGIVGNVVALKLVDYFLVGS